jgi:hypothetical protein
MKNIKEKYQKAQSAFDKIIDWQDLYSNPPNTLPIYTTKQRIKDQILLNNGISIISDVKST